MDNLRIDCMLSEILEEKKSLSGFLESVFGFLYRKTDFYHIQKTKEEKIGFPPGIKEKFLLRSMQKFEKSEDPTNSAAMHIDVPPPAIQEIEIESSDTEAAVTETETFCRDIMNLPSISAEETKTPYGFSEDEYKNGTLCGKYCWSQTLKDMEVSVHLPAEVKTVKHLKLTLKSTYISIKGLVPKEMELLCGDTWDRYRHNDVVWTISDGKLVLSFDKSKEIWWEKFLTHESPIDVRKLDTNRPINDYSEETQRAILKIKTEELIRNNQQEAIKLSPPSEAQQLSWIKQALKADDSPFKGQSFDPPII